MPHTVTKQAARYYKVNSSYHARWLPYLLFVLLKVNLANTFNVFGQDIDVENCKITLVGVEL